MKKIHKDFFRAIAANVEGFPREGDLVILEDDTFRALFSRYQKGKAAKKKPVPSDPSPLEMAQNFAGAMARWVNAGFATVERGVYEERLKVCSICPHWDSEARLGLGKCKAPGCGCSKFKHWLASEKCPLGNW